MRKTQVLEGFHQNTGICGRSGDVTNNDKRKGYPHNVDMGFASSSKQGNTTKDSVGKSNSKRKVNRIHKHPPFGLEWAEPGKAGDEYDQDRFCLSSGCSAPSDWAGMLQTWGRNPKQSSGSSNSTYIEIPKTYLRRLHPKSCVFWSSDLWIKIKRQTSPVESHKMSVSVWRLDDLNQQKPGPARLW